MSPTNWRIPVDLIEDLEGLVPSAYPTVSRAIDDLVRRGLTLKRSGGGDGTFGYAFIELFYDPSGDGVRRKDGTLSEMWRSTSAQPGLLFHSVFAFMGLRWETALGAEDPTSAAVVDMSLSGMYANEDARNFLFPERIMGTPFPGDEDAELPIKPMPLSSLFHPGSGFANVEAPMTRDKMRRERREIMPVHDTLVAFVERPAGEPHPEGRLFAAVSRIPTGGERS
jgi:hypothetical protein